MTPLKEDKIMKAKKYYLILGIIIGILCIPAQGEMELPSAGDESMLIGRANPALAGIEQLYVIIEPSDDRPSKDGLVWKELQEKVEHKLKETGIEITPGAYLGRGTRAHDVPELRVYMEMLKFADLQLYVFRIQTSLATKAYLQEQGLFFKAEVWKAQPEMEAVSVQSMPAKVTDVILGQVEAFIHAYLAANPQGGQSPDANDIKTVSMTATKERAKPAAKPAVAEYKYVASKNSKVFHRPQCSSAKRIKPENLVGYSSRGEVIKAGKRPCKICKP